MRRGAAGGGGEAGGGRGGGGVAAPTRRRGGAAGGRGTARGAVGGERGGGGEAGEGCDPRRLGVRERARQAEEVLAGGLGEFVHRGGEDELAVVEDGDVVAEFLNLGQIVRADGDGGLGLQTLDEVANLLCVR